MFRWTTSRGVTLAIALAVAPSPSFAQTPEDLAKARELFKQAYEDEQEKRFPEALEKFLRVAAVKETPAVRYRIGAVLEGSGRLREARDTFRALAATKEQLKPEEQDIAASAAERVIDLDRRLPKLLVRAENPPPDTRIFVDGAPIPVSAQPHTAELDPGEHVVAATAPGHRAFESRVVLQERSEVPVGVVLEKEAPPVVPSPKTAAWIAIGAGAAFVVTGTVFLLSREGAIEDIEDACPNGVCPVQSRNYVEDARDRATVFGPFGVGFLVVGAVAIGTGVYLLSRKAGPTPSALVTPGGATFGLGCRF